MIAPPLILENDPQSVPRTLSTLQAAVRHAKKGAFWHPLNAMTGTRQVSRGTNLNFSIAIHSLRKMATTGCYGLAAVDPIHIGRSSTTVVDAKPSPYHGL
jgi:hypothetical protein